MTWKFGSHMSVAGGMHLAIDGAHKLSMNACQVFTKNASQWKCKPLDEKTIAQFAASRAAAAIDDVCSHASYLINLATPNEELWLKSIDALVIELERADALQLTGVVVHPGAYVDSNEQAGLERIVRAVEKIFEMCKPMKTSLLLENTAGQGSTLGWNMSQLAFVLSKFRKEKRLGACIDTCHAHAAGYDLSTTDGIDRLVQELTDFDLAPRVAVIHMNDSKKEAGSRVDRHEHLGSGTIGVDGLTRFIHQPIFAPLPMILETAKGTNDQGEDWDAINMRQLFQITGRKYSMPELAAAKPTAKAAKERI